jgi:hypothetical protein
MSALSDQSILAEHSGPPTTILLTTDTLEVDTARWPTRRRSRPPTHHAITSGTSQLHLSLLFPSSLPLTPLESFLLGSFPVLGSWVPSRSHRPTAPSPAMPSAKRQALHDAGRGDR